MLHFKTYILRIFVQQKKLLEIRLNHYSKQWRAEGYALYSSFANKQFALLLKSIPPTILFKIDFCKVKGVTHVENTHTKKTYTYTHTHKKKFNLTFAHSKCYFFILHQKL